MKKKQKENVNVETKENKTHIFHQLNFFLFETKYWKFIHENKNKTKQNPYTFTSFSYVHDNKHKYNSYSKKSIYWVCPMVYILCGWVFFGCVYVCGWMDGWLNGWYYSFWLNEWNSFFQTKKKKKKILLIPVWKKNLFCNFFFDCIIGKSTKKNVVSSGNRKITAFYCGCWSGIFHFISFLLFGLISRGYIWIVFSFFSCYIPVVYQFFCVFFLLLKFATFFFFTFLE